MWREACHQWEVAFEQSATGDQPEVGIQQIPIDLYSASRLWIDQYRTTNDLVRIEEGQFRGRGLDVGLAR